MMCRNKRHARGIPPQVDITTRTRFPIQILLMTGNRAKAALHARMRVESDLTYQDLDLVQPYQAKDQRYALMHRRAPQMMVPFPRRADADFSCSVAAREGSSAFANSEELKKFKYQRYMQKSAHRRLDR